MLESCNFADRILRTSVKCSFFLICSFRDMFKGINCGFAFLRSLKAVVIQNVCFSHLLKLIRLVKFFEPGNFLSFHFKTEAKLTLQ